MSAQGYYEDQLEEAIGNLFRYYHTGGGGEVTLYPGGSRHQKCPDCEGTGKRQWKHRESPNHSSGSITECPRCGGRGYLGLM